VLSELAGSRRQVPEEGVPFISNPELGEYLRKNTFQKAVALQQKAKTVPLPAVASVMSL